MAIHNPVSLIGAGSSLANPVTLVGDYIITYDLQSALEGITDSSQTKQYYVKAIGNQLITSRILIPSYVTLDLYGCRIYYNATSEKFNVFKNKNAERACTLTSSGTTATCTLTSHGYQKGQPIEMSSASETEGDGSFYIDTITDDDTFTYEMASTPASALTGAAVCQGDTEITILGGDIDYNYNGVNGATLGTDTHAVVMVNVHRPTFQNMKIRHAQKYAILVTNCADVDAMNIGFDTESDGFHITGPCDGASIRHLWGRTEDDILALTTIDWTNYQFNDGGDIDRIYADGIFQNTTGTSSGVKLAGASGHKIKNVNVKNIRGLTTIPFINCIADNVTLGDTYIERLSVENISYNGGQYDDHFISVDKATGNTLVIEELIVSNSKIELEDAGAAGSRSFLYCSPGSTINELTLNNVTMVSDNYNGAARAINHLGTIGQIFINGGRTENLRSVVDIGTTANDGNLINMTDHIIDNCNMGVYSTNTDNTHLHCNGVRKINTNAGASVKSVLGVNGGTGCRLTGDAILDANAKSFGALSGGQASVSGEFIVDQTETGLTPISGDIINDQAHATPGRYEYTAAWAKI